MDDLTRVLNQQTVEADVHQEDESRPFLSSIFGRKQTGAWFGINVKTFIPDFISMSSLESFYHNFLFPFGDNCCIPPCGVPVYFLFLSFILYLYS